MREHGDHCDRVTGRVSPCHLVTLSPCHLVTLSPCHLVTLSPPHPPHPPCSRRGSALDSLASHEAGTRPGISYDVCRGGGGDGGGLLRGDAFGARALRHGGGDSGD